MVSVAMGAANRLYWAKEMRTPCFSAMPTVVTLADAPTTVALPPRHAPRDSAHHSTDVSPPWNVGMSCMMMGMLTATYGMLSMKAERMADTQQMRSAAKMSVPWSPSPNVVRTCWMLQPMPSAMDEIRPVSTAAPTTMKRNTKKLSVGHSMSFSRIWRMPWVRSSVVGWCRFM